MPSISKNLVKQCKEKLLTSKEELLNRVQDIRKNLHIEEKGGDEADQTARILNERDVLGQYDRIRKQLFEIEQALARIEAGTYGICEETEEFIEEERLLAIPWTRLSIEGAEIRESLKRKYAR